MDCVYCAVRTETLTTVQVNLTFKGLITNQPNSALLPGLCATVCWHLRKMLPIAQLGYIDANNNCDGSHVFWIPTVRCPTACTQHQSWAVNTAMYEIPDRAGFINTYILIACMRRSLHCKYGCLFPINEQGKTGVINHFRSICSVTFFQPVWSLWDISYLICSLSTGQAPWSLV
jgi:hypothetical protein